MNFSRQSILLAAAALLFLFLALVHPLAWLDTKGTGIDTRPDAGALYVDSFEQPTTLREAIIDQNVVGYASEATVDIRSGGSEQARYYLAQFALAPVLLELKEQPTKARDKHRLVLANFLTPDQLNAYLTKTAQTPIVLVNPSIALVHKEER